MPNVPSDQNIRELCARLIATKDPERLQTALSELRSAIREHIAEMENKGIQMILRMGKASTDIK